MDAISDPRRSGPTTGVRKLPPKEVHNRKYGMGNDRVHLYFEKSVLFDHADYSLMGTRSHQGAQILVDRVLQESFRATVCADAIKALYNHIRHRLQRQPQDGGRGASEAQAEADACAHIEQTFLRRGAWHIVTLDAMALRRALPSSAFGLHFDDLLEFQAYRLARARPAGPTFFVTRNEAFPEGIHPTVLARQIAT